MQLIELIVFIGMDFVLLMLTLRTDKGLFALVGGGLLTYVTATRAGDGTLILQSTLNSSTGLYVDQTISISPILVLLGFLAIISFYVSYQYK